MTIEISSNKILYTFRQNPYNPRIIDRRKNQSGQRWEWFRLCESADEARAVLLKLERKPKDKPRE